MSQSAHTELFIEGNSVGSLEIRRLSRSPGPEDRTSDPDRPENEPAIALHEASEYYFTIRWPGAQSVSIEPSEVFNADPVEGGIRGRINTRQYVGDLPITVRDAHRDLEATAAVTVKAAKLDHDTEFRRMLRDIADLAAEATLQGFAPATASVAYNPVSASRLLYQQFALLHARLLDDDLDAAFAYVVARPHQEWIVEPEAKPPGFPVRTGSQTARALTRPGRRVAVPGALAGRLASIPAELPTERSEETLDTVPNRFVRFALERWRDIAQRLRDELDATKRPSATTRRGQTETQRVLDRLDGLLGESVFREAGPLHGLPSSNQVLLKREGYRQVFATFALVESGLSLDVGIEDLFNASQRDIATLYEFWTFLKLVEIVGARCGEPLAPLKLLERHGGGLSLGLRRGKEFPLRWTLPVAGRTIDVLLVYNRTFTAADGDADGSWSREMVPDASLLLRPRTARPTVTVDRDLDLWLHFDAKYRLENARQFARPSLEQQQASAVDDEIHEATTRSRREDLLKMHAYRDSIRRSAGAYVLFPGTTATGTTFKRYREIVPGIGAFALRPGDDTGMKALAAFLDSALLHVADQATQEERSRYWVSRIFDPGTEVTRTEAPSGFLQGPPADVNVLVGYVHDAKHWRWIEKNDLYNLRPTGRRGGLTIDAEELAAPLLLLYEGRRRRLFNRVGAWRLVDREEMIARGYRSPSDLYLCAAVEELREAPSWLEAVSIQRLGAVRGAPIAVPWVKLIESAKGPRDGEGPA